MEPPELRSWRNLENLRESEEFLESFWILRDPDLRQVGNPNIALYERRSEEADQLFDGEGQRGALTSRGRAYLLMGAPSSVQQSYLRGPALGNREARRSPTQSLLVETWSWRPEDLSPSLRTELEEFGWKLPLEVSFRVEAGRYALLEGEELLHRAARSWMRTAPLGE